MEGYMPEDINDRTINTMASPEFITTETVEDIDESVINNISTPSSLSNQMIFLINSLGSNSEGMSLLNQLNISPENAVLDIHALATANLISQTQEAIMQEYNICDNDYNECKLNNEPGKKVDVDIKACDIKLDPRSLDCNTDMENTELVNDKEGDYYKTNKENSGLENIILNEAAPLKTSVNDLTVHDIEMESTIEGKEMKENTLTSYHKTEIKELPLQLNDLVRRNAEVGDATAEVGNATAEVGDATAEVGDATADVTPEYILSKDNVEESSSSSSSNISKSTVYVCHLCRRQFSDYDQLQTHSSYHKPLVCPEAGCERTFTYPSHFRYHLLTHRSERKHDCECGKVFYTSQQLSVHKRLHTGSKPFVCKTCDKAFTTAGNLRNHQRMHTGERPFKCDEKGCSRSFAEISSLKKHKLTHSGEKPFQCNVCSKRFSQTSSRNYHMKRHLEKGSHSPVQI